MSKKHVFVTNIGARRKLEVCFYRCPRLFPSFLPLIFLHIATSFSLFLFVQPPVPPSVP